jgi:hypothetical protein
MSVLAESVAYNNMIVLAQFFTWAWDLGISVELTEQLFNSYGVGHKRLPVLHLRKQDRHFREHFRDLDQITEEFLKYGLGTRVARELCVPEFTVTNEKDD